MAITISGQNNNDRILASDGVLDSISGFSVVGVMTASTFDVSGNSEVSGKLTASHLDIGSNIKIGNAGIITATTLIGNVTGNINHTSNILLQISGSEKFRVGTSGQLGIGGANYGSSGQVLTSGGSGSAATWSTVSGTTINNNANNRIITGSGTANTLEAETSLEWNGTDTLTVVHPSSYPDFKVRTSAGGGSFEMFSCGNGPFRIGSSGTSPNSSADELVIGNGSNNRGLTILGGTSNIYFGDSSDNDIGKLEYNHSDNSMRFTTNTTEKVRILSSGELRIISSGNNNDPAHLRLHSADVSISTNDAIGVVRFAGRDAASSSVSRTGALIQATAAATWDTLQTNGYAATHLDFFTQNNSGTDTVAAGARLRLSSDGNLLLGSTTAAIGGGKGLMIADSAGARIKLCDSDQGVDSGSGFEILASNGGTGYVWNRENQAILFGTNGTERMRITHEGSVGIGTNNSTYELEVHDGSGAAALRLKDGANNVICDLIAGSTGGHLRTTYNHPLKFSTNQVERMRINTDGTVYFSENIASQSPTGQFGFRMDRGGGNGTIMNIENLSNDSVNNNAGLKLVTNHSNVRIIHHNQGGFYVINSGNGYLHYYSNGQSRVFIDTNGNVCVGTQSASSSTQAKGISLNQDGAMISRRDGVMHYYKSISTGGYYANVFLSANTTVGSIFFNSGGTQFNTSSDYRRKENVVSLTDGISKLKQLKPYRFNFKDNPSETIDGFLAHEAQEVVPHTVTGTKDQVSTADDVAVGIATTTGEPIYQQMDLSKLVPLLTAALQEETAKREALEARVSALEGS